MVGRCISYWNSPCLRGNSLVFPGLWYDIRKILIHSWKPGARKTSRTTWMRKKRSLEPTGQMASIVVPREFQMSVLKNGTPWLSKGLYRGLYNKPGKGARRTTRTSRKVRVFFCRGSNWMEGGSFSNQIWQKTYTPWFITCLHLKMDDWKTILSFWDLAYFQVRTASFREVALSSGCGILKLSVSCLVVAWFCMIMFDYLSNIHIYI